MVAHNTRDKIKYGFVLGVIVPFITFVSIYLIKQPDVSIQDFIIGMKRMNALMPLIALSVLPNLLIFTIFNKLKYDKVIRGIMLATFVYAFLSLLSKLI